MYLHKFYHALRIHFENFGHIEVLFSSTYVIPSLLNQKIHPYMPVKIIKHEIDLFIDTRHFRRPKIQFWMATSTYVLTGNERTFPFELVTEVQV